MHVTFETAGPRLGGIVEMVFPAAILGSHVTPVAQSISLNIYLAAVWFMAIFAHHTGHVHFTLKIGSIYIHFIQDLTV
jgi:hypothetical protein